MEKSILNEISVKQLYDYPESGCMKMSLIFLVCSVAKKENHQLLLELADLKYKISNVFVDDEKKIKARNFLIVSIRMLILKLLISKYLKIKLLFL